MYTKTILQKDDQVVELDLCKNILKKTWGLENERPIKTTNIFIGDVEARKAFFAIIDNKEYAGYKVKYSDMKEASCE